jgi:hypothetical protein
MLGFVVIIFIGVFSISIFLEMAPKAEKAIANVLNKPGGIAYAEDGSLIKYSGQNQGRWYSVQDDIDASNDPRPHFRKVIGKKYSKCTIARRVGAEDIIIYEYGRWMLNSMEKEIARSPVKFMDVSKTEQINEIAFEFKNITSRYITQIDMNIDFIPKNAKVDKERITSSVGSIDEGDTITFLCQPRMLLKSVLDIKFHMEDVRFADFQV